MLLSCSRWEEPKIWEAEGQSCTFSAAGKAAEYWGQEVAVPHCSFCLIGHSSPWLLWTHWLFNNGGKRWMQRKGQSDWRHTGRTHRTTDRLCFSWAHAPSCARAHKQHAALYEIHVYSQSRPCQRNSFLVHKAGINRTASVWALCTDCILKRGVLEENATWIFFLSLMWPLASDTSLAFRSGQCAMWE